MTDIESLYKRYAPDVRRFVLFLAGDPVVADEITSDTFVSAWLARERIRQPTVKSYLFAIARRNLCSIIHAVSYRASASWRCKRNAETPRSSVVIR